MIASCTRYIWASIHLFFISCHCLRTNTFYVQFLKTWETNFISNFFTQYRSIIIYLVDEFHETVSVQDSHFYLTDFLGEQRNLLILRTPQCDKFLLLLARLEFLESKPFKYILPNDIHFFRYIDNILIIYPNKYNIETITNKLNNIEPTIKLIPELEKDNFYSS